MSATIAAGVATLVVLTGGAAIAGSGAVVHRRARTRLLIAPAPSTARPVAPAVPGWLSARLEDAALPVTASSAWHVWLAAGPLLAAGATVAGGAGAAVVTLLAWVVAPGAALAARRGARGRAIDAALPDALEAMAQSLRAGAGIRQVLDDAAAGAGGPLGPELRRACAELRVGVGLAVALASLERRCPEPGVRLAVAALVLGAEAGGAHAQALDGVAEGVRTRLGVAAEVRALASQARLSALVIAAAPVAFAVLAAGADRATATFLLGTPLGLACLATGLVLDGLGALWMHRIAQVET